MLGRLKFELDVLANQMLDQLPESVWTSNDTPFFDPSIGGGQFIKLVVSRLTKYGHSVDNIRSRVHGFAENQFALNYTIARHALIGTFEVGSVLEAQKK